MLYAVLCFNIIKSYFKKISSNERKEPNDPENPNLEKSNEEQVIVLFILYLFISTVLHTYFSLFQTLYYYILFNNHNSFKQFIICYPLLM